MPMRLRYEVALVENPYDPVACSAPRCGRMDRVAS